MTNEQIILESRVFLMKEGLLKGTGVKMEYHTESGEVEEIEMPEEIHTFNTWKKLGYVVKKGEHSIARFPIWQKVKSKAKQEDEGKDEEKEEKNGRYYKKVAFFFTIEQVEKVVNN